MSLTYYFPAKTSADLLDGEQLRRAALREVGLDDVLADVRTTDRASIFDSAKPGPGGTTGVFLIALRGEPPKRLGFYPDFQAWHSIAGGKLWIGTDHECPTTPACLARDKQIPGYRWQTAAGEIIVPVLRSPAGRETLPKQLGYDDDGLFQQSIKAEYRELWEASAEIWDVVIAKKPGAEIPLARGLELCLGIIGLNYRYGKHEQNILHWVDSENWIDLLALAVDAPAMREYAGEASGEQGTQKKTESQAPDQAPA